MAGEQFIPRQPTAKDMSRFEETVDEHDLFRGSYTVPPMRNRLNDRYGQGNWYTQTRTARTMAEKLIENMGFEIHDVFVTPEGDVFAEQHPPEETGQP
jgi:hypothetical protein